MILAKPASVQAWPGPDKTGGTLGAARGGDARTFARTTDLLNERKPQ
jgi:hypothetical protein